ncbi:MAG: ABC transporter permease [Fibrobacter sp.]|nr:ABC transporter permease [Fibrobacter sp.]
MRKNSKLHNFINTAFFTINDELHYRSFYVLTLISVLFVFMLRGCFSSDMFVNGERVDSLTVGWHASIFAFHAISAAGVLIAVLLSMRLFRRDRENGMAAAILSKPVSRVQYLLGKTAGIFLLSYGLTFILHLTVYLIMLLNTGGKIVWFLPASLIVSLNILFAVAAVSLFTLFMSDVIAAILGLGIAAGSFVIDSFHVLSNSRMIRSVMGSSSTEQAGESIWAILWPKLTALQYYATSLIQDTGFKSPGPLHPAVNIAIYSVLCYALLIWRFNREEIQ